MEVNKYYYIDENGRSVECLKTGKFPNKFIPNKTGHMGFVERQAVAKTVSLLNFMVPLEYSNGLRDTTECQSL